MSLSQGVSLHIITFSAAKILKNHIFGDGDDFYLGGPAPCGRRRAIRCTRFARAAPIPAATESRGGVGILHSVTGLRDGQTLSRQISWQS